MYLKYEDMYSKLMETNYAELQLTIENQKEVISKKEEEIKELNLVIEQKEKENNEILQRKNFNFDILNNQYNTLVEENEKLMQNI